MATDIDPAAAKPSLLQRRRLRKATKRSVFWRWRRLFFLLLLVAVAAMAGVWLVLSSIALPERDEQLARDDLHLHPGGGEGLQRGQLHGAAQRRGEPGPRRLRGPATAVDRRRARRRGPGLLQPQRHRPGGHQPGGLCRHPRQQRVAPGWLDHHPAVRQERLPDQRAHADPQAQGSRVGGQARGRTRQGRDPRALPEHGLLRSGRLRRRGRVEGLLRQERGRAQHPRRRLPGRAHPGPGVSRRAVRARRGHVPAELGPRQHAPRGLHQRGPAHAGLRHRVGRQSASASATCCPGSRSTRWARSRGRSTGPSTSRSSSASSSSRSSTATRSGSTAAACGSTRPSITSGSRRPTRPSPPPSAPRIRARRSWPSGPEAGSGR